MRTSASRRLLAALAATAAALLATPVPAHAAAPPKLDMYLRSYTVTPGDAAYLATTLFADRAFEVAPGVTKVVYRVTGDAPGVHLQESGTPGNCAVSRPDLLTLTCGTNGMFRPAGWDAGTNGYVQLDADAEIGAVATLTATLTVKGFPPVVRTSRIRVGEAVQLTAPAELPDATATLGGPVDVPLRVTNQGERPVRGVGLEADTFYSFQSRAQYSNCWYHQGALTACVFDQTLEPGATYGLSLPYRIRRDTAAPSDQYGSWDWQTTADFEDRRGYFERTGRPFGTPGRGGVLRLTPVAAAKADPPQANTTIAHSGLKVGVTGTQITDLAAVGAQASGKAGATVPVTVGLRNRGPAVVDRTGRTAEDFATTVVVIPRGTTATKVPDGCFPVLSNGKPDYDHANAPGRPRYFCSGPILVPVGSSSTVTFGLRINQVVTGARGSVTITNLKDDADRSDNTAAIVINPAGAPAPGDGGGSGGGGGGLPITGPGGAFSAGVALLLVGLVLYAGTASHRRLRRPGR